MDAKRLVRSCVSFYGMFAASALAVSFVCGLIMFMYRMKTPEIVAFLLLLQEYRRVPPVALGNIVGV